jgi:Peptidase family M23
MYRTRYSHLIGYEPSLVNGQRIKAGQRLGPVGNTGGTSTGAHLHMSFHKAESNGANFGWFSKCWNGGFTCPNGENPQLPQGRRPTPMLTTNGAVTLVDGATYTSVNGRVFFPNLSRDTGIPRIIVQNKDGQYTASINISVRNTSGTQLSACSFTNQQIAPTKSLEFSISCGDAASAYVDGDRDFAAIVESHGNAIFAPPNNTPIRSTTEGLLPQQLWNTKFLPMALKNVPTASGTAYSSFLLQNPSSGWQNANIELIGAPGSGYTNFNIGVSLPPNGQSNVSLGSYPNIPNGWTGSAIVTGDPIAVSSNFFTWNGGTRYSFNAFNEMQVTNAWSIPLFMIRNSGLTGVGSTPLTLVNVSNSTINLNELSLSCNASGSSSPTSLTVTNSDISIPPNGIYTKFNPATNTAMFPSSWDNWVGSCVLSSPLNKNIVVLAQIRFPANLNASMYQALSQNGLYKTIMYPLIEKRLGSGNATAVTIRNLSTSNATSVTFYYKGRCWGSLDYTVGPYSILPGKMIDHNHRLPGVGSGTGQHNLPDGWCGSLTVVSDSQPIDGSGQSTNYVNYSSGDTIGAYNGILYP